jgi:hypothetical protein
VGGLGEPQGVAPDAAGNLLLTELTRGRLEVVVLSFKLLQPAASPPQVAPGQGLCVRIARASTFSAPVSLEPDQSYRVVRDLAAGSEGEVMPTGCPRGSCHLRVRVRSGERTDSAWLAYIQT